jgi:hypothetical protein
METKQFKERRHHPRVKLERLTYINLTSGNGGIVLDMSENGLALQAVAPIEGNALRFRLSIGSTNEFEAMAELVWRDSTRKRGGLRFTQLPKDLEKEIRTLLGRAGSFSPGTLPPSPEVAEGIESNRGRREISQATEPKNSGQRSQPPARYEPPVREPEQILATSRVPPPEQPRILPDLGIPRPLQQVDRNASGTVSVDRHVTWRDSRDDSENLSGWRVMIAVLALGLGIAVGISSFLYKKEMGDLLVRFGERLSGETDRGITQPEPSPIAAADAGASRPAASQSGSESLGDTHPTDSEKSAEPPLAGDDNSSDGRSSPRTERAAGAPSSGKRRPAAGETANLRPVILDGGNGGEAELALALEYLRDAGHRNRSAAAQMLWLAVEKGSTQAEIELADLYLRGEGVPRSCEQARILLSAAYNNNNDAAGQRLAQLDKAACR